MTLRYKIYHYINGHNNPVFRVKYKSFFGWRWIRFSTVYRLPAMSFDENTILNFCSKAVAIEAINRHTALRQTKLDKKRERAHFKIGSKLVLVKIEDHSTEIT